MKYIIEDFHPTETLVFQDLNSVKSWALETFGSGYDVCEMDEEKSGEYYNQKYSHVIWSDEDPTFIEEVGEQPDELHIQHMEENPY